MEVLLLHSQPATKRRREAPKKAANKRRSGGPNHVDAAVHGMDLTNSNAAEEAEMVPNSVTIFSTVMNAANAPLVNDA